MDFTSMKTCTSIGLMAFTLGKYVYHKLSHLVEKYSFGRWHVGLFVCLFVCFSPVVLM